MKTYSAKPSEVSRQWYLIDAASAPIGRLATVIARRLMGKHKPTYTPHIDVGDGVIVINAAKLKFSGRKLEQKIYYRHSGYLGNLKETTAGELKAKNPAQIIHLAVRGMLPANKLRDGRLSRLKIYDGEEHDQSAQKPLTLEVTDGKIS